MENKLVYIVTYSADFGSNELLGVFDNKAQVRSEILKHMELVGNVDMEEAEEVEDSIEDEYTLYESPLNKTEYQLCW